MQHLVYRVRYSVVPINSSLLTILLGYNDTRLQRHQALILFHDFITGLDCIYIVTER